MTTKNYELMAKIAERAQKMKLMAFDRISLVMDLEVATEQFNLRLEELLNADDFNFAHDICGIQNNINRRKREITSCFVPRFSAKGSYYKKAFKELIAAGVPRWYIRLYLLTELIHWSKVYVYHNPHDVETQDSWYATNAISLVGATLADRNRKCYGELNSMGFPTWGEYKTLFDGDEYDQQHEFLDAYDRHQEEWMKERERERHVNYAD